MNQCEIPCVERQLGTCLQAVGIFEYRYDIKKRILYLPEAVAQCYGWERQYEDMPYGFAKKCVSREFREEYCRMYEAIRSGQQVNSCDFQIKGTDIWLRNKMCRIEGTWEAVGFLQDISQDYRKAERASKRFITSVQNLYDAIYEAEIYSDSIRAWKEKDEPNNICRYESFRHYLQVAWWDIVHPDHREKVRNMQNVEYIKGLFAEGRTEARIVIPRLTQEGVYKWFQTRIQLVEHTADVMRIMIYRKDVDQELKEEEANKQVLRDALALAEQANNAKTDFLSRMSHDIRTPLNAIIGMSTIAGTNLEDTDKVADCLAQIGTSSRFLLGLVNNILDLAKIENGKMSLVNNTFSLYRMVDALTVTQLVAKEKRQTFGVSIAPGVEEFYMGDEMRIQQVLMNLLSNASKYTPVGGKYTLRVSTGRKTGNHCIIRFTVEDNGEGIRADFLEKMFEPFTQATHPNRRKGSGLGLAIAQNLVHLMNGTLTVKSEYGEGSCFTVEIPLEMIENDRMDEVLTGRNIRVLVVDDDLQVCEQAAQLLLRMGIDTEITDNGHEALSVLKSRMDTEQGFDVAIVDWQMPEMDGIETVRRIRKLVGRDVLVVVMSAYDWTEIEQEAREAGVDLFLPKPIYEQNLRAVLVSSQKESKDEEQFAFHGEKVLLVEDNELNQEVAKTLLEMNNLQVEIAPGGVRGLEMFLDSQPGYYLAILMDIQMPDMDGYETTERIRSSVHPDAASIPIYAMTANAFSSDVAAAKASGMNGHIAKPVDFNMVTKILMDIIKRKK